MTRLGFKHCNRCDRDLVVTEFYRSRKTGHLEAGCKECRRATSRKQGAASRRASGVPVRAA